MDYLKYNLTPIDEVKGAEPKNEAEKAAREELKAIATKLKDTNKSTLSITTMSKSITVKTGNPPLSQ